MLYFSQGYFFFILFSFFSYFVLGIEISELESCIGFMGLGFVVDMV